MIVDKIVALHTSRDRATGDHARRPGWRRSGAVLREAARAARSRVGTAVAPGVPRCRRGTGAADRRPAPVPCTADHLAAYGRIWTSAFLRVVCTARRIAVTCSGTNCSCCPSQPAFPRDRSFLAALPLAEAAGGPPGGERGRLRGRDVSVAERRRRRRRDPASPSQPALRTLAAGQLAPPAACGPGDRLQRLAVLPGHRRSGLPMRTGEREMLLEIARFWASVATLGHQHGPVRHPGSDGTG